MLQSSITSVSPHLPQAPVGGCTFYRTIFERMTFLDSIFKSKNLNVESYQNLSEIEKIPLRVIRGEIVALEFYLEKFDLEKCLEISVKNENYCGAEGIKNAQNWLKLSGLTV